jgi:predicted RNase H-like HicB family nuclease
MAKLKYPFVIYPASEGGYVGEIPSLNGCLAQGDTLNETLEELEVVETLWLKTAHESGLPVPALETEIDRVIQALAA